MAGQPRKQAAIKALAARGVAIEPEWGAIEYIEHWVESGKTLRLLAQELTRECGFEITPSIVSRIASADDASRAKIDKARKEGAKALVEEAMEIIDDASIESREAIAKAKAQADLRTWIASKMNREVFGDTPAVALNLNLGSLHIDALRARPAHAALQPAGETVIPADQVELLEAGGEG